MKKIIAFVFAASVFALFGNAQIAPAPADVAKPQISKEDKEKIKLKQEADLAAAFAAAGITAEQEKLVREVMESSKAKTSLIKKDDTLKEEDKKAKLKEANDEKNEKMKEIMGADKYRLYNAAKAKQKEEAAAAAATKTN